MRILEVITAFDIGGAERLLGNRLKTLAGRGGIDEYTILYLKGSGALVPAYQNYARIIRWSGIFRFLALVRSADVIHAHLLHAMILCMCASLITRKRLIITLHNNYYRRDWRDHLIFLGIRIGAWLLPEGSRFIGISKAVSSFAIGRIGIPPSMVVTIENGVMEMPLTNRGEARCRLGIADAVRLAIAVGRLEPQKRPDWCVRALANLPPEDNWHLYFVGAGALRPQLEKLVAESGLGERVHFAGAVESVQDYYAAADLLLLPSKFEGFGLVLVEALRVGLPVLASNLEGPAEIVKAGQDGELFDAESLPDFRTAWSTVYRRRSHYAAFDSDRKMRMSRYDMNTYADRVLLLYSEE